MISDPAARPPLDVSRLTDGNPELMPDLVVEVVAEVASTNAAVAERARAGEVDGFVLVAEHQSAGRGRLDRTWETPPGAALTFSLLLRPQAPTASWPWLPLLTGYAVDKALKAHGLDAGVKWPNDVLIGERKVAGILVERIDTDQGPAAVVGVGINVAQQADDLPVPSATSVAMELGDAGASGGSRRGLDRTDLLVEVLNSIREAFTAWELGGDLNSRRLAESYAAACVTVGRDVRVDLPDGGVLEGRAVEIDPAGQLVVESDGGRVAVSAGDVVHVRSVADR